MLSFIPEARLVSHSIYRCFIEKRYITATILYHHKPTETYRVFKSGDINRVACQFVSNLIQPRPLSWVRCQRAATFYLLISRVLESIRFKSSLRNVSHWPHVGTRQDFMDSNKKSPLQVNLMELC